LIPELLDLGAAVIWRCHIGVDQPNDIVRETWAFLRPYIEPAAAYVFSRKPFAWEVLDPDRVAVIEPSIDAFSCKNVELDADTVRAVLNASGLVLDRAAHEHATFTRLDGTPGRIEGQAQLVEDEPLHPDTPVVLQVSRWDALKDPLGVIRGFGEHVPASTGTHLVYAAPSVESVADDPEGRETLQAAISERERLPEDARRRIHLASLPMDDADENATMVNALQRHASVVAQKSIAEGFGLTVAEAMWKARPVVASRTGGIQDQIVDGESGVLLDDPSDLASFGAALTSLLADPQRAEEMGRRARERVRDRFLSVRSLIDYLALTRKVLAAHRDRVRIR
jgi:trehalose synthase